MIYYIHKRNFRNKDLPILRYLTLDRILAFIIINEQLKPINNNRCFQRLAQFMFYWYFYRQSFSNKCYRYSSTLSLSSELNIITVFRRTNKYSTKCIYFTWSGQYEVHSWKQKYYEDDVSGFHKNGISFTT